MNNNEVNNQEVITNLSLTRKKQKVFSKHSSYVLPANFT